VKAALETFVLTELRGGLGRRSLAPDDDLIAQGIVDSLGLMQLVSFVEDSFGIEVADEDLVIENFQTLARLERFIETKRRPAARA
jgi:acyl carrier protein